MAKLLRILSTLSLLAVVFQISESVCPVPKSLSQRRVQVDGSSPADSYDDGVTLTVSCPDGQRLNGTEGTITCTTSSQWTPYWPKCVNVLCPVVVVQNAKLSSSHRRAGSRITVTCGRGLILTGTGTGPGTLTCQNNGSWTPTPPSCVPGCPPPQSRGGLSLRERYLEQKTFQLGASVSYRCSLGYVHSAGSPVSHCTQRGWSAPTLKCERRSCGSAGEISNGRYIYADGAQFGDTISAVCNEGYYMIGGNTRSCTISGWDGQDPVCESVQCPPPPQVAGAEVSGSMGEQHLYGHSLRYRCRHGYLVGEREIYCTKNGTWSAPSPQCKDVKCPQPVLRFGSRTWNYKLNYKPDEQVSLACDRGYRMEGASTLTCGIHGQWNPPVPRCVRTSQ